jgi:manganese efflux pump family protein
MSMSILPLLLFILPLGLDTLGVSMSLGMKSRRDDRATGKAIRLPAWFTSAMLFSMAEAGMPLLGLAIGYATSLVISNFMHFVGPLILIGVGLWELLEESQEYFKKKKQSAFSTFHNKLPAEEQFQWRRQLLLALSVSLDELAIGFSLGTIAVSQQTVHPLVICMLIGIQGFLMTLIGITLGRMLRTRLRNFKEWTEFLSAFLLIGLGIWLLVA